MLYHSQKTLCNGYAADRNSRPLSKSHFDRGEMDESILNLIIDHMFFYLVFLLENEIRRIESYGCIGWY